MKCKTCNNDYDSSFDEDFIDGECLPCSSQKEFDKYCADEAKEFNKYNKKYNTDFDDDSFYNACYREEIDLTTLKGFPKIRSIAEYADRIKKEIEYYDNIRKNKQLDLFESDDLPF